MHTSNTEQNTEMTDQSLRDKLQAIVNKFEDYVACDEYHIHQDSPEDHIKANSDPKDGHMDFDEDKTVDAIIACFKDEGYMKLDTLEKKVFKAMDKLDTNIRTEHKCMTGAEWFERFEIEYNKFTESYNPSGDGFYEKKWGIEAAKRASNLTPETRKERRKRMSDHWEDL